MANVILFLFGLLSFMLGIVWNANRKKLTERFSKKYRMIWVMGALEMIASIITYFR
jgi:uncharacterized membrane protein YidH (DUF202 family)